jgi:hypothetical protein
MPLHRDRQATPHRGKIGPPLRGRSEKSVWVCQVAGTGNQPAQRVLPTQRHSPDDHGVQTWSTLGLSLHRQFLYGVEMIQCVARAKRINIKCIKNIAQGIALFLWHNARK